LADAGGDRRGALAFILFHVSLNMRQVGM
jgi:hypothetical protein